jgi:phage tail tape-measure protein
MITNARLRGIEAALTTFGIDKTADAKSFFLGNPTEYMSQLRNGQLFSRTGMIAKSMDPRTSSMPVLSGAMMYGLPAYQLYQAARSHPGQRGSAVGSLVGGLAGGALGGPLGLVGSAVGSTLGSALGESVGRHFNRRDPQDPRLR